MAVLFGEKGTQAGEPESMANSWAPAGQGVPGQVYRTLPGGLPRARSPARQLSVLTLG